MRKRVGAAVIAVLSVGGLLLGNGSAQAASKDIPTIHVTADWNGGSAEFKSSGDKLVVCDNKAGDGYGAVAYLMTPEGISLESVYDGTGDGTCLYTAKDLYEETVVYVMVCLERFGVDSYCNVSALGRV